QCSFHIAEKMPSSVSDGGRPIKVRIRSYSSAFRPWAATSAGVIGSGAAVTATNPTLQVAADSLSMRRCRERAKDADVTARSVYLDHEHRRGRGCLTGHDQNARAVGGIWLG